MQVWILSTLFLLIFSFDSYCGDTNRIVTIRNLRGQWQVDKIIDKDGKATIPEQTLIYAFNSGLEFTGSFCSYENKLLFAKEIQRQYFAYALSDSMLKIDNVQSSGHWGLDSITNTFKFMRTRLTYTVQIEGDKLIMKCLESVIEMDNGDILKKKSGTTEILRRK